MRAAGLLIALLAGVATSAPARAQDPSGVADAMAGVIHNALAPNSYGDWRYRWDAVSIRISSLMHWHLPGPDQPGEDAITRRGWISAGGKQVSVTALGSADHVTALALEYGGWPGPEPGPDQLIQALAARGVTATETARTPAPDFRHSDQPVIVYLLSAEGRDDGVLTQTHSCTSPQSAAAQRCEVRYLLDFSGK